MSPAWVLFSCASRTDLVMGGSLQSDARRPRRAGTAPTADASSHDRGTSPTLARRVTGVRRTRRGSPQVHDATLAQSSEYVVTSAGIPLVSGDRRGASAIRGR